MELLVEEHLLFGSARFILKQDEYSLISHMNALCQLSNFLYKKEIIHFSPPLKFQKKGNRCYHLSEPKFKQTSAAYFLGGATWTVVMQASLISAPTCSVRPHTLESSQSLFLRILRRYVFMNKLNEWSWDICCSTVPMEC